SDLAREAITPAAEMARKLQAELLFLQVVDSAEYPYLFSDPATWKDAEPELAGARQSLAALADPIRATGQAVQVLAAFGSPAAPGSTAAGAQSAGSCLLKPLRRRPVDLLRGSTARP